MTLQELRQRNLIPPGTPTLIATPQSVKKKDKAGRPYMASRWAWKMRAWGTNEPHAVLIGLRERGGEIEEAFVVPTAALAGKKFLYRNRTHHENRVGSFLEPFRVRLE